MKSCTLALLMTLSMAVVHGATGPASAATFTVDTTTDDAATACVEATPNDRTQQVRNLSDARRPLAE